MGAVKKSVFWVVLLGMWTFAMARASELPDFSELAEQIRPSVVNVSVIQEVSEQRNLFEELFRRRFGEQPPGEPEPSRAIGSGFIISEDGYILTNKHVVDDAETVTVRLSDRREFKAKVIGTDAGTDVALLKIDADDLPAVRIGTSKSLKPGQWVMAVGQPFGFDHTVTAGIVSAKKRQIGSEQYVPFIQTDVAINPGNSGGPLVDMHGRVVGINSQIWTRSGGYMGISFAIPIEIAMSVVKQLKEHGKVRRGFLGVTYQDVDHALAQSFGMKEVYGAIIPQVSEGSPAEKGGLKAGDIVLEINGQRIETAADLPFIIGQTEPGEKVRLLILRDGKRKVLDITVGERPEGDEDVSGGDGTALSNRLGLKVAPMSDDMRQALDENGVVVISVEKGPAFTAGIRRGDVIVSINRKPVTNPRTFKEVVKELPAGKRVPVLIVRPRLGRRFLVVEVPEEKK